MENVYEVRRRGEYDCRIKTGQERMYRARERSHARKVYERPGQGLTCRIEKIGQKKIDQERMEQDRT